MAVRRRVDALHLHAKRAASAESGLDSVRVVSATGAPAGGCSPTPRTATTRSPGGRRDTGESVAPADGLRSSSSSHCRSSVPSRGRRDPSRCILARADRAPPDVRPEFAQAAALLTEDLREDGHDAGARRTGAAPRVLEQDAPGARAASTVKRSCGVERLLGDLVPRRPEGRRARHVIARARPRRARY